METLLTQDISKSSAMQRAGRAGREVHILNNFNIKNFILSVVMAYRERAGAFACILKQTTTNYPYLRYPKFRGVALLQVCYN